LALGLSATSLVASPGLLSLKAQETPAPGLEEAAAKKLGVAKIGRRGKVLTNSLPEDASWADLVTGDEVGNAGYPDLGKIQQVLITLVLLSIYAGYVFVLLASPVRAISSLPTIDKTFVWLLAISHAAYLGYKAAPHTASEDAP
jgi:hypothetical protein